MIIAVDGMGGDFAPYEIVKGCVEALNITSANIIITGPIDLIKEELLKYKYDNDRIEILNTTEVISPSEHPAIAIKNKKDSSLVKALFLLKDKKVDCVISAGSTGALLAGAILYVGRVKGIKRPALAPIMPGVKGPFMIVDAGANIDCKPEFLAQFALMGKVYFENVLKHRSPKIGLVNIGSEEEKGNELTKATHQLLKNMDLNFVGNVEPREVTNGEVQVLVCDGFVGNTILKMYEGVSSNIFKELKENILSSTKNKIAGLLLKPVFDKFKKDFDYTEYGGAPFLGVNGICIKAHGSSNGKAIKNAIRQADTIYKGNVVKKIADGIEKLLLE